MARELTLSDHIQYVFRLMEGPGVFLTAADSSGATNLMTIGWGLIGRSYEGRDMFVAAVTPLRHTWRFMEESGEFAVAAGEGLEDALMLCGTKSGRDMDKWQAAGISAVQSPHVSAPGVAECAVNIECRTYFKQTPPHMILTPAHRKRPLTEQHTIYFAEILGVYAGA